MATTPLVKSFWGLIIVVSVIIRMMIGILVSDIWGRLKVIIREDPSKYTTK